MASRSARIPYRPDIDGLRAIAVLAVVGYHVAPGLVPGGFVGVDIFFVVSGFLISTLLFADASDGHIDLAAFYRRRVGGGDRRFAVRQRRARGPKRGGRVLSAPRAALGADGRRAAGARRVLREGSRGVDGRTDRLSPRGAARSARRRQHQSVPRD